MKKHVSLLGPIIFVALAFCGVKSFAVAWNYTNPPGTYGDIEFTTSGTLTAGTYTFNNLTINSGVTVTISGNTSTTNGTGVVIVAASVNHLGTINGNGRGFASQGGPGAGSSGSSGAGAGHGGNGGWTSGATSLFPGVAYGTSVEPTALGSGGGRGATAGGVGGGAIKIVATGDINLGGAINVNGLVGSTAWDGGGSGGSIWIEADNITGTGALSATGGAGGGAGSGAGAGGRIYLAYKTARTHTGVLNVASGGGSAQPGSGIVVKSTAPTSLLIPVNSTLSNGTYTYDDVTIPNGVTATVTGMGFSSGLGPGAGGGGANGSGAGHGGAGSGASPGISYGSSLNPTTLGSGGGSSSSLGGFGGGALHFVVSGTMTVSGTLASNGSAAVGDAWAGAGSGGSIWVDAGTWAGAVTGAITANGGAYGGAASGAGGGRIYIEYSSKTYTGAVPVANKSGSAANGSVVYKDKSAGAYDCGSQTVTVVASDLGANISVTASCSLVVNGDVFPASVSVTGAGAKLTVNGNLLVTGTISVSTGGALVMGSNKLVGVGYVVSAASINIGSGSSLNADGMGYDNGLGQGAGGSGNLAGGGGGYGGTGGAGNGGGGGSTYGFAVNPYHIGSSGGNSITGSATDVIGSAGGGAIILIVPGTVQIDGTVSANGVNGTSYVGAGSGGTVNLTAGTIQGTGYIRANGGVASSPRGGGGGGRIYISVNTWSFTAGNVTVTGGGGYAAGAVGIFPGAVTATTATSLAFVEPLQTSVRKNTVLDPAPMIVGKDGSGNISKDLSATITFSAFSDAACTAPATGTITNSNNDNPLQFSPISGVGFFAGVFHNTTETIYVQGSAGALKTPCVQLVVGGAIATELVFTTQPADSTQANVVFARQPVIEARDADGVVDSLANISAISVYSDATCTTYVGAITGTGANVAGVTSYSGVKYTTAGVFYLKASSTNSGITAEGCSAAFEITPGAATKLGYLTQPSATVVAGVNLATHPVVAAQDAFNNTVSTFTGDISFAPFTNAACTTAGTGTLTGQGPYTAVAGSIIGAGISYTKSGSLRLRASASGLTSACSNAITVNPGAIASLAWYTAPPATADVNANFSSPVIAVTAADVYANAITLSSGTFTFAAFTDSSCTAVGGAGDLTTSGTGFTSGRWRVNTATYKKAGVFYFKISTTGGETSCSSGTLFSNKYVPYFFRGY